MTDELATQQTIETRVMSLEDAASITEQIKNAVENLWDLLAQAYTGRAWEALSYASWEDYCALEFRPVIEEMSRERRGDTVRFLRGIGMSTRAIAAATCLSQTTVLADLADQVNGNGSPDAAEVIEGPHATVIGLDGSATVIGLDGKRYRRERKPKRQPKPLLPARMTPRRRRTGARRFLERLSTEMNATADCIADLNPADVDDEAMQSLITQILNDMSTIRSFLRTMTTQRTTQAPQPGPLNNDHLGDDRGPG